MSSQYETQRFEKAGLAVPAAGHMNMTNLDLIGTFCFVLYVTASLSFRIGDITAQGTQHEYG
jgi:hypothetical protein